MSAPAAARVSTDAEGRFRLPHVPGPFRLTIGRAGFATSRHVLGGTGAIDVVLGPPAMLSGRVIGGEVPADHFSVVVRRVGTAIRTHGFDVRGGPVVERHRWVYARSRVGIDGAYRFDDLPAGTYEIIVRAPDSDRALVHEVARGLSWGDARRIDFEVVPTPRTHVVARVIDEQTGERVVPAIVTARGGGPAVSRASADGSVRFSLRPDLVLRAPGYSPRPVRIQPPRDGDVARLELPLTRTASVMGRVTDAHGEAQFGVRLSADARVLRDRPLRARRSNRRGQFALQGLVATPGTRIVARAADGRIGISDPIDLVPGATTKGVTVRLRPCGSIVGRVWGRRRVDDVALALQAADSTEDEIAVAIDRTEPDAGGAFAFRVPSGRYRLAAWIGAEFRVVGDVTVEAGCVARVDLDARSRVRGRVIHERGGPVPGARVAVEGCDHFAITDRDGRFVLTGASATDARLVATAPGWGDARVRAVGGSVEVVLPSPPRIHGHAFDSDGRPVRRFWVRVYPGAAKHYVDDPEGRFSILRPKPGFRLEVGTESGRISSLVAAPIPAVLTVREAASIVGRVRRAGRPLRQFLVAVSREADVAWTGRVWTDDVGRFVVGHLRPGAYRLRIGRVERRVLVSGSGLHTLGDIDVP